MTDLLIFKNSRWIIRKLISLLVNLLIYTFYQFQIDGDIMILIDRDVEESGQ